MLQKLFIRNYAIIEEVDIDFSKGLNIITGETGAGKSILMGALSLILGERAEAGVLNDKAAKCIVEGCFVMEGSEAINTFLTTNELEPGEELLIRREVAPGGKSRAFINDTPVSLAQLKKLSSILVDLHQQFDTAALSSNDFQREVLDALAGNGSLLAEYAIVYKQYTSAKKELEDMLDKQQKANAVYDYQQYLYAELAEAGFRENELEELEVELKLLNNAESVKEQVDAMARELKEGEQPVTQQLKSLISRIAAVGPYHPEMSDLARRVQEAYIEIADVADELENISGKIEYDAEKIQIANDRLSAGYKLLKKHSVTSTNELLVIQEDLNSKLNEYQHVGEWAQQKEKEVKLLLADCERLAQQLSAGRQAAVPAFVKKANSLLKQVGMPNAHIKVHLLTVMLTPFGKDEVEFLFDANLPTGSVEGNGRFEPLRKVASGGELSRLMLCIKSMVANKLQLPTLIFDEIDTGISGEAARQVGGIMKELAGSHQIIAITHQPQIAARADAHYFVYKLPKEKRIVTAIKQLDKEERITTVAKMLGGENPTPAAMENAREMVDN